MKNKLNVKTEGFTIIELLVTLALSSIAITFAYTTLTYIQKLFCAYKLENRFIQEYADIKDRFNYESIHANYIIEKSENEIVIKRDSILTIVEFLENKILFRRDAKCDTFHIEPKKINIEYELSTGLTPNSLIRALYFETEFESQKFKISFLKMYDSKMRMSLFETVK